MERNVLVHDLVDHHFAEALNALTNTLMQVYNTVGITEIVVSKEMGLRLGAFAGETIKIATSAGEVKVRVEYV